MSSKILWNKVEEAAIRSGRHINAVADDIGISRSALYNYRNGKTADYTAVDTICKYFGWHTSEVWEEIKEEGSGELPDEAPPKEMTNEDTGELPDEAPPNTKGLSRRRVIVGGFKGAVSVLGGVLQPDRQAGIAPRPRVRSVPRDTARSTLTPPRSHEETAEDLNRAQQWADARLCWLLAAEDARRCGDWRRWARSIIAVGQMAINLGQLELGKQCFTAVLGKPAGELPALAIAEANIRLGWLYVDREEYLTADPYLTRGLQMSREHTSHSSKAYRVLENATTITCDEHDAAVILENTALHFLGKLHIATGHIRAGIDEFEQCGRYAKSTNQEWAQGFRILEQIPGMMLMTNEHNDTIEKMIDDSRALLNKSLSGEGFVRLTEARWRSARDIGDPMRSLVAAREGFTSRTFYARGLADVNQRISRLYRLQPTTHAEALRYALAAMVVCPYASSCRSLEHAVRVVYNGDLNSHKQKFGTLWREIEEEVWSMESIPFSDLRGLVQAFGFEHGVAHLKTSLELARNCAEQILSS